MRVMWKFPVGIGENEIEIPRGYLIKSFQCQKGTLCFWALVDPEKRPRKDRFLVIGTGQPIPKGFYYAGTAQEGDFVWHLFEEESD